MCFIRILLLLIVNTVRALAVPFWPLSVFWRYLVYDYYSITGFVADLSTITDSCYIFLKGEIYFGYAAVVAHRSCSLRLDGTKARLVLWDGEIWLIKLDGDKAYVVHWHPLQGNDFGSHCALRLKYVSFFGVLSVHLGINLLSCFG